MPGPGTAVVIVQREGEENIPRVGRMTGRAGSISAPFRPELPPLKYEGQVVLLARVANQKMMAAGVYTGPKDGQDSFRLTGAWSPSDNRRDPRLPVQVKAEVRPVGVRATLPVVIKDLSAGGARVELAKGEMTGEVDLIVRYGGFSATLPAYVLNAASTSPALAALPDEPEEQPAEAPAAAAPEAAVTVAEAPGQGAEESGDEDATGDSESEDGEAPAEDGASAAAKTEESTSESKEPTAIRPAAEDAASAAEAAPVFFRPTEEPVEFRLRFAELNLPQQGFLRHMLRDLAEISGWELAS